MSELISPLEKLLNRLCASWGDPGQAGDIDEIYRNCGLMSDALARVVSHEEKTCFAKLPEPFEPLQSHLMAQLSEQAQKFEKLPDLLDSRLQEAVLRGQNGETGTIRIEHTIVFELSDEWADEFSRKLEKAVEDMKYEI